MAKKYLDDNGLLYFWSKIKTYVTNAISGKADKTQAVSNITRNGTTFTATKADGTTFTFTQQDNTVAKTTTSPKMDGTAAVGSETKYAAGDHVHPHDTTKADKSATVSNVAWDSTNKKLTKTINGTTSDVVAASTIKSALSLTKSDVGLGNVDNTKDIYKDVRSAGKLTNSTFINGLSFDGTQQLSFFANCQTAADVNPKVISLDLYPRDGALIAVRFQYGNTVDPSQLAFAIEGIDDMTFPVKHNGSNLSSASDIEQYGTYIFVFLSGVMFNLVGTLPSDAGLPVQLKHMKNIEGVGTTGFREDLFSHFAICSSSGSSAQKKAVLQFDQDVVDAGFTKADTFGAVLGARIFVKFTETNTASASSLTLGIEDRATGGNYQNTKFNIKYRGGDLPTDHPLRAGGVYEFVFDGTNWQLVGDLDTTYSTMTQTEANTGSNALGKLISAKVLDTKIDNVISTYMTNHKGANNGLAPLNSTGTIDSEYLPSFVDDVVEAYPRSGQTALSKNWLAIGSASGAVINPQAGVIYILMEASGDYAANTQFRWSGSTYVEMAGSGTSAITNGEIDTITAT